MRTFAAQVTIVLGLLVLASVRAFETPLLGECGDFFAYDENISRYSDDEWDRGFESRLALRRYRLFGQVLEPAIDFGVICNDTDIGDLLISDENGYLTSCEFARTSLSASSAIEPGKFLVPDGTSLAVRFTEYIPNGEFSHVRFWYASGGEVTKARLFYTALKASGTFDDLDVYDVENVRNSTTEPSVDCPGQTPWRRYDIPLAAADMFINETLKGVSQEWLGLQLFFSFSCAENSTCFNAIDGVELVNLENGVQVPPSEGIDRIAESKTFENLECPELQADGIELDTFAVASFSLIGICLLLFAFSACLEVATQKVYEGLVRGIDALWFLVSLCLAALAVVELLGFEEELDSVAKCTEKISEATFNATNSFHPSELSAFLATNSVSVFGSFLVVLPPYSRQDIESLFTISETRVESGALFKRFCNGTLTCTQDSDTYFTLSNDSVATNGALGVYTLIGEVTLSLDHWINLLRASFAVDIGLALVNLVLHGCIRHKGTEVGRARAYAAFNLVSVLTSVGFTTVVLYNALFNPVEYSGDFLLRRDVGRSSGVVYDDGSLGTFVQPTLTTKDQLLSLDLSAVSEIRNSLFTKTKELTNNIAEVVAAGRREVSPSGLETQALTCPLVSLQLDVNESAGRFGYSLDCTDGTVPLLPQSGLEERQQFLLSRVIIGLVVVDFLITFTDSISLILLIPQLHRKKVLVKTLSGFSQFFAKD